jgi:hypothetical protein
LTHRLSGAAPVNNAATPRNSDIAHLLDGKENAESRYKI